MKASGVRRMSVVRTSVSNDFSSEAVRPILFIFHIKHLYSIGRGNVKLCCLFQPDKNPGCYGNL